MKIEKSTIISGKVKNQDFNLEYKITYYPEDISENPRELCLGAIEKTFQEAFLEISNHYKNIN